jgi:hypothetical protein
LKLNYYKPKGLHCKNMVRYLVVFLWIKRIPVWRSVAPSTMEQPWTERSRSLMLYVWHALARLVTAKPWGSNTVLVRGMLQRYRAGEGRMKSGIED